MQHAGLQQPTGITAEASGTSGERNSMGGAALEFQTEREELCPCPVGLPDLFG